MKILIALVMAYCLCGHAAFAEELSAQTTGYVYSSFTGDGEDGLHLLTSTDGKNWKPVRGYASLYRQSVGLMRDPSICVGGDGEYHLVWTTGWWEDTLGIAHSKDLVNWTPSQKLYPWADYKNEGDEESSGKNWPADLTKQAERNPKVRNCWAPEIFYDKDTKEYVIFWATTIDDPKVFSKTWDARRWERMNQRIYYITTKDFKAYTPRKFFYAPEDRLVIDACMVSIGPKDYRMVIKDEAKQSLHICFPAKPFTSWAEMPRDYWGPMSEPFTGPGVQPDNTNAEGPTAVQSGDGWNIYCDYWMGHRTGLFWTKDFKSFTRMNEEFNAPVGWVRHGTVFKVPVSLINALHKGSLQPQFSKLTEMFLDEMSVKLSDPPSDAKVYYTLDGSEPSEKSNEYKGPITIKGTTKIRIVAIWSDGTRSPFQEMTFKKAEGESIMKSIKLPSSVAKGVEASYYELEGNTQKLPDFSALKSVKVLSLDKFTLSFEHRGGQYGVVYQGYVTVPVKGMYAFSCESDDGSSLSIGDKLVVQNDGVHGMNDVRGYVALEAGAHPIKVQFFQGGGGAGLVVRYQGPGIDRCEIPKDALCYEKK